jgi:hypothetical protein
VLRRSGLNVHDIILSLVCRTRCMERCLDRVDSYTEFLLGYSCRFQNELSSYAANIEQSR